MRRCAWLRCLLDHFSRGCLAALFCSFFGGLSLHVSVQPMTVRCARLFASIASAPAVAAAVACDGCGLPSCNIWDQALSLSCWKFPTAALLCLIGCCLPLASLLLKADLAAGVEPSRCCVVFLGDAMSAMLCYHVKIRLTQVWSHHCPAHSVFSTLCTLYCNVGIWLLVFLT